MNEMIACIRTGAALNSFARAFARPMFCWMDDIQLLGNKERTPGRAVPHFNELHDHQSRS